MYSENKYFKAQPTNIIVVFHARKDRSKKIIIVCNIICPTLSFRNT